MTYATKARTLDDIAADKHVFSIIAMDQRNTLRRMFTAVGLDATDDDLRVAKAAVPRVLTPAAPGRPGHRRGEGAGPGVRAARRRRTVRAAQLPGRAAYPPRPRPDRPVGPGSGRRCPQVLPPAARRPPGLHGLHGTGP